MFKRIVALLSLAILVVAGDSQCDTGTIMCCNPKSTSSEAAEYFGIVGRRATNECTGVSIVGTSQSCSANQEPLCCEEVKTDGLVNLSCSPINVNA
ncbi:fungal hydrophobin [Suillus occidentalis]|nr:fungal hydrophobin [Suillus occidentalis]